MASWERTQEVCPNCRGTGKLMCHAPRSQRVFEEPCHVCDGSGQVEKLSMLSRPKRAYG